MNMLNEMMDTSGSLGNQNLMMVLHELMSLSSDIENRVNELCVSCVQDEFDINTSGSRLLTEASMMLVKMLEEEGIKFHIDLEDLLSNYYNVQFLITLYQNFVPHNIEVYIRSVADLYKNVCAYTSDVADDEYLIHLLEASRDTERSQHMVELYTFAIDKVISTSGYVKAINEVLMNIATNGDDSPIVVKSDDIAFLMKLNEEKRWANDVIINLVYNQIIYIEPERIQQMVSQYCQEYSSPNNLTILSQYESLNTTNPDIVKTLLLKISNESESHMQYYSDEAIGDLSIDMIMLLLLSQFTDKRLFDRPFNFKRIIDNANPDHQIERIISSIPIQNKL